MTARSTWKAEERNIAADLGGTRIPVTGIDRDGADVLTPMFAVQSKLRRSLPAWLFSWLGGIVQTAGRDRVGVLILRKPRMERKDALVIMRYADFCQLHGPVKSDALSVIGVPPHGTAAD